MIHKCRFCTEDLEDIEISDGPTISNIYLNFARDTEERAGLYACTSRDCKNCGVVLVIPLQAKED